MDDGRILATYRVASYLPLDHAAAVIAGEQSSGTFTKVALESDDLMRAHGARVESIETDETPIDPLPGAISAGAGGPPSVAKVAVSFPVVNLGPSIAALLATVAGNLYELRELAAVKLLDVEIPEALAARYTGPLHGVGGTRRLVGNPSQTMIGTIVKPSIGLTLEQLEALVRELAEAQIDFIKDDELNSDPPYAPLTDRIRVVMRTIRDVADRTGKQTMYAFNVTGDMDDMKRAADLIAAEGGTCVMAAIPSVGFSAFAELRRHTDLALHGHRAGFGAFDRSPSLGIGFRAFQRLARVAGADHLHVGGINSKFWEPNDAIVEGVRAIQEDRSVGAPMLPVLSSAQTAATAASTYELLPTPDLLVLAGGGIHAHPGGVAAGVQSMREAWHAVASGQDPRMIATPGSALDVALDAFGS